MDTDWAKMNKEDVRTVLDSIITKALGGPRGDPLPNDYKIATVAYLAMKHFGLDVSDLEFVEPGKGNGEEGNDSTVDGLKGKNIYKCDFTKEITMNLQTALMRDTDQRQVLAVKNDDGTFSAWEYVNHPTPGGSERWLPTLSDNRHWPDSDTAIAEFSIVLKGIPDVNDILKLPRKE
jgi:hypothetical protein